MRSLDNRLRGGRLTRAYANKNRRNFASNDAIWSFHNQICINFLIARCRKISGARLGRFRIVSVHKTSLWR